MQYAQMIIAGLLGVILHAFVKIQGINKRSPTENFKSVLGQYWKSDWATFSLSVFVVISLAYISDELIRTQAAEELPKTMADMFIHNAEKHTKMYFIGAGYLADSLLYLWLGRAEKALNKKVEEDKASDS